MDTRIGDVISSLEIGTEDVRMIGIKGIGGGGKTTLARAVYDQISHMFEGKSFVENVREVSTPTLSGLKKLQKKILKDVLNKQDITFSSVHDGKNMLKDIMRRRKTLVVLDDVDRLEQLEALAGEYNWFKFGSRIIITTRDEQLLLAHRVNMINDSEAQIFVENVREVSKASIFGLKNLQEQVLSNKRLLFSLGILITACFYSMASSSNSSAPKIMVSTSTSSIQKRFVYEVFISFRGEDTRYNFVSHLDKNLNEKGIRTYKDDKKMKQGKTINNQLIQAIKDSRFFIIVFSKNYASSSWCLDELVEIMKCQKTGEQTAYPIFFKVEPTQVRKQSGDVGKAFAKHEKDIASLKKWKEALTEAANLAGWELKNGDEADFIEKVAKYILRELRSISFGFDEKLVGMETRVRDVISSLEMEIDDEVLMVGIKGIGGSGKTTTARAVFDHLSNHFKAKIFVAEVREVSNGSVSGLMNLQEQILSKMLNEQVTLDSVDDGKNMMKRRMFGKKLLLVLDDVDHIDQLEALAGDPKWFKPGSRILITTTDEQVLLAHGVNVIRDVALLSQQEAICLFSRYAFGTENPVQGYEELSGKVVRYAAGLPLTLKVLGSLLRGKEKLEWDDAIKRQEKIPLKETQEKHELLYTHLDDDYKQMFLDIACILKGYTKEYAIRILESCGFHARIGLKVLEQRSLITISKDEYGSLGMHDSIEKMGKYIVRRSHPEEPNKHSRLWIDKEIEDILANDKGTEETKCLRFNMSRGNSRSLMKGLAKMKNLRYLEVNYADYDSESGCKSDGECLGSDPKFDDTSQLDESTQYFPNSLKYLKLEKYPFLYLPKTFQANNLVGLEIRDSRMVQLWEEGEKKVLKNLRFLCIELWNKEVLRIGELGTFVLSGEIIPVLECGTAIGSL